MAHIISHCPDGLQFLAAQQLQLGESTRPVDKHTQYATAQHNKPSTGHADRQANRPHNQHSHNRQQTTDNRQRPNTQQSHSESCDALEALLPETKLLQPVLLLRGQCQAATSCNHHTSMRCSSFRCPAASRLAHAHAFRDKPTTPEHLRTAGRLQHTQQRRSAIFCPWVRGWACLWMTE